MHRNHRSATLLCLALSACQANVNLGPLSDTDGDTNESDSGATTAAPPVTSGTSEPATSEPGTSSPDTSATSDPGTSDPGTASTEPGDTMNGVDTTDSGTTGTTGTGEATTDPDSTTSGSTTTDSTTGGSASLDEWTKYRNVLIDNALQVDLVDYQVSIQIDYDGDMAPDYADLRFTDESGVESLPYWIEWETGPLKAYVWVRVPLVFADDFTTIRMYYGNPDATPGSNGFDTFLFFDDFEAPALDLVKWKATAPVELASGRLKITKGSVYSNKIASSFPDTTIEVRMQQTNENIEYSRVTVGEAQLLVQDLLSARFGGVGGVVFDGQKELYFQGENFGGSDVMNIWGLTATTTDVYPRFNRVFSPSMKFDLSMNYYVTLGHPSGKQADLMETKDVDIDWVLVRRHAKPAPETLVGGEKLP